MSTFRVGIVGVSGYGGGEALRLIAGHPNFRLVYASGESSAGSKLIERFPGLPADLGQLTIEKWDPAALPPLDVLLASLPTGESMSGLAQVPASVRVVDIGGDHRFKPGWTYGLADVWPDRIRTATRVANPGCYPAATLLALAPLFAGGLVQPDDVIIDAKSGVSGAGRGGGGSTFGFAEVNEDVTAYGLLKHAHAPEINAALSEIYATGQRGGPPGVAAGSVAVTFTPHLIPMTRGILSTIYLRAAEPGLTTERCLATAREFYRGSAFVRVTDKPPHTKWATGSNLAFVSYAADPSNGVGGRGGRVIALGVVDNLGKGAAGQAIQNANLMTGLPPETGLSAAPLWP